MMRLRGRSSGDSWLQGGPGPAMGRKQTKHVVYVGKYPIQVYEIAGHSATTLLEGCRVTVKGTAASGFVLLTYQKTDGSCGGGQIRVADLRKVEDLCTAELKGRVKNVTPPTSPKHRTEPRRARAPKPRAPSFDMAALPPTHLPVLRKLLNRMCSTGMEAEDILRRILPEHSRVYSLEPKDYGSRGGKIYRKPCGWLRFGIRAVRAYDDWCVAYHGTKQQNISSILSRGLLRPGSDGVNVAHGQST